MIFAIGLQLVFLAVGVLGLLVIWHRPGWVAFAAISSAAVLDCLELGTGGLDLGVNVYVDDVACLVLLLTGLLLLIRYRKGISRDAVPALLLLGLLALVFVRGVSTFGLRQAGNSVRSLLVFTAPALALMMLQPVLRLDAGRLARWIGWAGFCFCVIALLRWAGALPTPVALQDDLREVGRALGSNDASVVGQAFIAAIYLLVVERRKGWWWWAGAGVFGLVTLGLQHRSVWVATAAGAAWLLLRTGRESPVRWLALGGIASGALCFLMIAAPGVLEKAGDIGATDLAHVADPHSTWAWRTKGYAEATDRLLADGALDVSIGPPAGWAARVEGGSFASTHIHSRYVQTLAFNGVVGASVLLVWFVVLIRRSWGPVHILSRIQPGSQRNRALLQAILFSELVYLVPYSGGILQSALLGLLWIAATQGAPQSRCRQPVRVYAFLPAGDSAAAACPR